VLQFYLQDRPDSNYSSHNKAFITKTADLSERHLFIRMIIYKDYYDYVKCVRRALAN